MSERIVVLGGGYAGVLAALRMGRRLRGKAQVTLVSATDAFVDRIRLHQLAAENDPAHRPLEPLVTRAGVELVIGRATGWRPTSRTLEVNGRAISYDRIIYALGSHTELDRVPGARSNAFTLEPESAARLARALPAVAQRRGRLVVCGGGLTAIETATELAESFPDLHIELVTQGTVGDFLSRAGQAHLHAVLARLGIARREQAIIREVRPDQLITDGERVPFDVCVWAGGFVANPLARAAGLPVNEQGQLLVDDTLRVAGEPTVFGAGDAVAPAGLSLKMGCKTAMPMGAHVADVVSSLVEARTPAPFRFGDTIYCISLGRRDGLVQFLGPDGALREKVWTGRLAAWIKERICRYTKWSLALESRGLLSYRWPRGRALAAREPSRLAA
jgi:NADH dehydrogenase FAD-containing subunit